MVEGSGDAGGYPEGIPGQAGGEVVDGERVRGGNITRGRIAVDSGNGLSIYMTL